MVWYFICDRTPLIPEAGKVRELHHSSRRGANALASNTCENSPSLSQAYSRDLLAFIFLVLTCVAFGSSLQTLKSPVLLNRSQTEEWKGWMQV